MTPQTKEFDYLRSWEKIICRKDNNFDILFLEIKAEVGMFPEFLYAQHLKTLDDEEFSELFLQQ